MKKIIAIFAVSVSMMLISCTSGSKPVEIEMDVPENAGQDEAAQNAPIADKWWEEFGDANLNTLIESALSGNYTLGQLWQRMEQAKEAAKIAGADVYPSLDISAQALRTKNGTEAGSDYKSLYSTGLIVNYELDIWGRVAASAAAGVYEWAATEQDMNAARISIAAQVADTWFSVVERRGQIILLDKQIQINSDSLDLVTLQFKRGQVETTDVLQQRQLLESKEGEKKLVEAQLEVLKNKLAVLTGLPPGKFQTPASAQLPAIEDSVAAGLTSELINRRPDIQAAYLRVQAADRKTAAAAAQRLPKFSLSASLDTEDDRINGLFDNWQSSIAADMLAPVFDAGKRKAQLGQQKAVTEQAIYGYKETVIGAIREVRDAIAQEKRQKQYLESLEKQISLSKKSVRQIKENYIKGAMDYLRFLAVQLSDQNLERQYLEAQKERITYRIELYKALAGGHL